ncbi:MAG: glycolate oxidase subunit GlcE [Chromatiales bacterium]|nr:glycolate oxidase subunit GlcE [Chromatiales bacterium]
MEAALNEAEQRLAEAVHAAHVAARPLRLLGSGSKSFYGNPVEGDDFPLTLPTDSIRHQPSELVVTVGAGTRLADLETVLAEGGQMLPFEPPHFGPRASVGGLVACGFSGPARPFSGSARDHLLGCRIINGSGRILHFGGEVMKNVAGYDISRLMCASLGTLGVILEASFKVLPIPAAQHTLRRPMDAKQALLEIATLTRSPLPLSAAAHYAGHLYLRVSGSESGVQAAVTEIGGETLEDGIQFWSDLREQRLAFFDGERPLWRLSVPPASALPDLPGDWLLDWAGAQRWLRSSADATQIRAATEAVGGHATLFRGGDDSLNVFHPLPDNLLALHRRVKQSFDPAGILNRGALYP